jgi:hypothetical protein
MTTITIPDQGLYRILRLLREDYGMLIRLRVQLLRIGDSTKWVDGALARDAQLILAVDAGRRA